MLLISGVIIIVSTAMNLIPNKQYYSKITKLSAPQLTPREFTFFDDVLDEGDKVQVHIESSRYITQINAEMTKASKEYYNLTIYIKDSQNTTLRQEKYSSEVLEEEHAWGTARHIPDSYVMDIFFQVPEFGKYKAYVVYEAWVLEQNYYSFDNRGPWYLKDVTGSIETTLWSDIESQKSTPNSTFLFSGLIFLLVGVASIPLSFVKRFR